MVGVTIGEEEKKDFLIHRGLLSQHSAYFKNGLSGRWRKDNVIDLNQCNPSAFRSFIQFIYSHRLELQLKRFDLATSPKPDTGTVTTPEEDAARQEDYIYTYQQLCEQYVLGDFLLCPAFQTAAMNALHAQLTDEWVNPWEVIDYVYENTRAGCGLRRFLVDWFAKGHDTTLARDLGDKREELNRDFVIDVTIRLADLVHGRDRKIMLMKGEWAEVDMCLYHDHEHVIVIDDDDDDEDDEDDEDEEMEE